MPDGQLTVLPVQIDSLKMVWPMIRDDLNKSLEYDFEGWTEGLVLQTIFNGRAHLHVGFRDEDYIGFTMTMMSQEPKGLGAYIWIAGGTGVNEAREEFEDWYRERGIVAVSFGSPRKGFERINNGYRKVATLYRKELDNAGR